MQYIEIKIVDKRFLMMGDGDPVKQMEERSAALREIEEKAKQKELSGAYVYGEVSNPFPEWLRHCIRRAAAITSNVSENDAKVEFLDENAVYRVEVEGDRSKFDWFYKQLNEKIGEFKDQEHIDWKAKNHVHVTSTPDDEDEAMRDLESFQRGAAPSAEDRADKKKGT